jgi:adenylate cyclase class IV
MDVRAPIDELEVKAQVTDPAALRRALEDAGAVLEYRGAMVDRRLDRAGSLTTRDEVLRLRVFRPVDGSPAYGVLAWKGPRGARGGYRHRAELETRVPEPDVVLAILERAGLEVTLVIERSVEVYRLFGAILRLEWYPAMDVLLEVEGAPAAMERAIAATGLPRERFLPESFDYFLTAYEARTGRRGRIASEP